MIVQQASKDIAKEREAVEKAKRAKEAQEKRERERQEKIARTNALVDINGGMSIIVIFNFIHSLCFNKIRDNLLLSIQ